jgi:hypothetical protein
LPFKCDLQRYHVELYEPVQLLADHELIEEMHPDTKKALEEKMHKFPLQPMPYFWRSLARTRAMQYEVGLCTLESSDPYPITYSLSNP